MIYQKDTRKLEGCKSMKGHNVSFIHNEVLSIL